VGIISDVIFRGTSQFLLLAIFTSLEIANAIALTVLTQLVGNPNDNIAWTATMGKTTSFTLGFLQTLTHVIQLITLPLVIAGRHRDKMDVKALPLAG